MLGDSFPLFMIWKRGVKEKEGEVNYTSLEIYSIFRESSHAIYNVFLPLV